ncbi:hypothetical protein BC567DRAFT_213670 [Phyllosticta citribraziliensis]
MEFFDSGLLAGPWLGRLASFGDRAGFQLELPVHRSHGSRLVRRLGEDRGNLQDSKGQMTTTTVKTASPHFSTPELLDSATDSEDSKAARRRASERPVGQLAGRVAAPFVSPLNGDPPGPTSNGPAPARHMVPPRLRLPVGTEMRWGSKRRPPTYGVHSGLSRGAIAITTLSGVSMAPLRANAGD